MPWPWHSAKLGTQGIRQSFFKKKILCRVPHDLAPGKEITKKNKKLFAGCARGATPGKEIIKKNLCRVPPRHGTRQRKFEKKN